jgi:hypothetical protein
MAKFEISLSPDYVPGWSGWEGIREILQNAKDEEEAHPEHGMNVAYNAREQTLSVSSEGVVLPRSVLLLGESGKRGTDARGKFGEGLDLGLLALVRRGREVTIENGDETWTPKLEHSEQWGKTVLVIHTRKLQKTRTHFKVVIKGVTPEDWAVVTQRVLFLSGAYGPTEPMWKVGEDTILPNRPGHIYVRDLWVGNFKGLLAGYNLHHAEIDRDRRLIDQWSLRAHLGRIWVRAFTEEAIRDEARAKVQQFLDLNAEDVQGLANEVLYTYGAAAAKVKQGAKDLFTKQFGDKAVPVTSTTESEKASAAGLKGVPTTTAWKSLVEAATGQTFEQRVSEAQRSATQVLTTEDLDRENLRARWTSVQNIARRLGIEAEISVVRFATKETLGRFDNTQGRPHLQLAVELLQRDTPGEALVTLVHEAAHTKGGDLSVDHRDAEEAMFAKLVDSFVQGGWNSLN